MLNSDLDNIPRVIHQIWLGEYKPPIEAMESWKKNNPDWTYCLWSEKNLPDLVNKQAFLDSDNYPQKADILRYEILHQYGGIYMDADVHCLKSIDPLYSQWIESDECLVAAFEGSKSQPELVANTFIACKKGNDFVGELVANIDISKRGGAWEITGPKYFSGLINKLKPKIKLLNSKVFFPIHHGDKEHRLVDLDILNRDPEVFGVHLWAGTKRAYEPQWYKSPFSYLFLQLRKSLNKTFQVKPRS